MRRLSPPIAALIAVGLLLTTTACGETGVSGELAAGAVDAHTSQVPDRADEPTTTTTTIPPTTTTAPAPAPAPRPAASSSTKRTHQTVVVTSASKPTRASACTEAGVLSMINRERAKHGLAGLTLRGGATSVACSWSKHMTTAGLGHNGNLSGDLAAHGVTGWRSIGENVGYASSASQVFSEFMASSGHRANILKSGFSQVGIGVVQSGSRVWVTLDFIGY